MDSELLSLLESPLTKKRSGMARTFTAAPGLVKLMNAEPWEATGLPEVYQMTHDRLERLKSEFVRKMEIVVK